MRAENLQNNGAKVNSQIKPTVSKEEISFFRQKIAELQNAYDQLFQENQGLVESNQALRNQIVRGDQIQQETKAIGKNDLQNAQLKDKLDQANIEKGQLELKLKNMTQKAEASQRKNEDQRTKDEESLRAEIGKLKKEIESLKTDAIGLESKHTQDKESIQKQ